MNKKIKSYSLNKSNSNIPKLTHFILASASPRRREILKKCGFKFKVMSGEINEENLIRKFRSSKFQELAKILSFAKAISVLTNKDFCLNGNETIFGFDTLVICKKKILGKPKNKKDALNKLLFLSGKEHEVITAFTIVDLKKSKTISSYDITKVLMRKITQEEAVDYIKTGEPLDKAGAYAIQGRGRIFVKEIKGDYYNVVGLPVKKFLKTLRQLRN